MNDPENDSEFVAFLNNTNTNYIKDGYLNIVATWANYTNNLPFAVDGCTSRKVNPSRKKDCGPQIPLQYKLPPVHSAKLHTFGKFQFKYGRVEIRARMPIGDWLYPYLILQPIKYRSEENFVNQLRIAFTRSNALLQNNESIPISRDRLFGSAVLWKSGKFSEYVHFKKYSTYNPLSNDFHNYTLIWHKDHITYKVDNNTYGTITNSTVLNAFNSECYIVLGLSAAGNVNFPDETIMFKHKRFLNNDPMGPYQFEKFTDKKTWTQPNLLIDSVYVYKTHGTDE
ncbi:gram-negative bacteria-binding protein 2-like [Drosophila navojoa]|uniref:gram-negative bacteria-binding protein 2-like n=1 Tax=Drosophila navojoa TaxID=7232 RepID=UPI0011BDDA64|nr:gram-negative bacteria-binding protein 2-like [Drosophila navojoa]